GTDVTEAFEAHHLNPNTVKVLEKFYKRDAKTPRNSPFTFKDDASVTMAWVIVAAHNYIHKRTSWRMYIFNIGLWSYRDFRVSHALSHHLYPNTLMDLEVSGFEPIVFWNPRKERPFYADYAVIIEQILFPFMFIMNFLKRFSLNFTRPGFFTQHYRWHDVM
ncbi:unnamed protein product, partial [Leptidea sinapis]